MDNQQQMKFFSRLDWKWVGVSYCMFAVFHLLPSLILTGFFRYSSFHGIGIGTVVWIFFGLTFVGAYVGYKSAGVTILEPALASIAYVITLFLALQQTWELPIRTYQLPVAAAVLLATFAIVFVSAWMGELLQVKRKKSG